MTNPDTLRCTKTHEWIAVHGTEGRVGITRHAQEEVSDVVFVELPPVGASVRAGQEAAVVESVKAAFSIYAPVTGTVTQVNERVRTEPGLVNSDPYDAGWLFALQVQSPQEVGQLMTHAEYDTWVTQQQAPGGDGVHA